MPASPVHVAPRSLPPTKAASDPDACWRTLFGTAPPLSAALVAQAVAWREQVAASGDVSAGVRRDLALAAAQARGARGSAATADQARGGERERGAPTCSPALPPASSQLVPGTRLVKAYGGRTHVVEVTEDGMVYERQLFASLSAIAKAITGTHWNGLLFFGLRKRKVYPARAAAHG